MMKKILAAILCAAMALTFSGCSSNTDGDTDGSGTGKGKGKRPGTSTGTGVKADGSIDWDAVPYADEADFRWYSNKASQSDPNVEGPPYRSGYTWEKQQKYAASMRYVEFVGIMRYTGSEKLIKIPERIEGKPVVTLNSNVFTGLSDISVQIPSSMGEIRETFSNCENVTLYITPSVIPEEYIKEFYTTEDFDIFVLNYGSFSNCKNVKVIGPESGRMRINSNAFTGCTDVGDMTFSCELVKVAEDAFDEQSIPKSITYKGKTYKASQFDEFLKAVNG